MRIRRHPLAASSLGTTREVVSFHYGTPGAPKAYIQAALHADELPGMLVAHHLRRELEALEARGEVQGEVVVVPVANPIGLAQQVQRQPFGRFDLATGENFNRHYPDLVDAVAGQVGERLGPDGPANALVIRDALRVAIAGRKGVTELEGLRLALLSLAVDADVVLDLHCDNEAVMHLYTGSPLWDQAEPLARYLGAHASLLETDSGDEPFDEAAARTWWLLRERFPAHPIPLGCLAATVELRGQDAVDHDSAAADARRILEFLRHRGILAGEPAPMPPLVRGPTPLAGSEALTAPAAGVVAFLRRCGELVREGDAVAEVIDPLTGETHTLRSSVEGVLYARENRHYALPGMRLAKIAGPKPFRHGKLLSD
jgi:predicted deacylase